PERPLTVFNQPFAGAGQMTLPMAVTDRSGRWAEWLLTLPLRHLSPWLVNGDCAMQQTTDKSRPPKCRQDTVFGHPTEILWN
ncbi:MAG: hypothetical protein QNK18_16920, partial [Gammaproteobacteria bacterium]|nr:hypothetical protein [Gammaproteobacteria bacterium]